MITLKVAEDAHDKKLADSIVINYHSYVASARTVGRCLKYLIYYDNRIIGTFWLGSGFKPTPKAILNHFNMGQKDYDAIFNSIADNKRFCMCERIPNIGSQVLKHIRNRARTDWRNRYGNDLRAIITTIGPSHNGSVYLADNWKVIGETAGLPSNRQSVSMKWDDTEGIKEKYVKPTGENKKKIMITERLEQQPNCRQTIEIHG